MPTIEEINAKWQAEVTAATAAGRVNSDELSAPAGTIAPVTKSDTVDLTNGLCRSLLVGTAGTATVIDATGATRTNVPLQAGYNPIRVSRVKLGGTASDIWALN